MINQPDLINSSSTTCFSILFWFLSVLFSWSSLWLDRACLWLRVQIWCVHAPGCPCFLHELPRSMAGAPRTFTLEAMAGQPLAPFQVINPGVAGFFYTQFLDWNFIRSLLWHQWGVETSSKHANISVMSGFSICTFGMLLTSAIELRIWLTVIYIFIHSS